MYIFLKVSVTTLQKKQFFSRINKITSNYLKLGALLAKLLKIFTNPLFSEKIFDYMKRRNTAKCRLLQENISLEIQTVSELVCFNAHDYNISMKKNGAPPVESAPLVLKLLFCYFFKALAISFAIAFSAAAFALLSFF